jgi:hypothetical protein
VVVVPAHVCGRRRHSDKQCLVIALADDEAVGSVVGQDQVGPAAADECAPALLADFLDGDPGLVLRHAAHAAEADGHRWFVGVRERHQPSREGVQGASSSPCVSAGTN